MAVGGDIIEITYNHSTLGSGVIFAKAAEDSTFDLGGFTSADDAAMVDGGGNMIDQINQKRWKFSVTVSWDMNSADELGKIHQLSQSPVQADWTISSINGTVWGGKGKPVGDYEGNGNAATFPLLISGGGKLKKISG
jgi:hypothetical protein